MISSIATVSGYGYTQGSAATLSQAVSRVADAAADAAISNAVPRNLPFLPTRVAFDSDINRFVLQFRNTKDGEITGQIPAGKSSQAYRDAQRLRDAQQQAQAANDQRVAGRQASDQPGDVATGETDQATATPADNRLPAPVAIGAPPSGSAGGDGAPVITLGSDFGGSTPAPAAVSSYSPPAPATQSSGRGTTA